MPITVSRKKLTVKTIAAKGKPDAAAESTAEGAAEGDVPVQEAAAPAATPVVAGKPPSYTLSVVFAILAFLIFGTLILFQYLEFTFLAPMFPLRLGAQGVGGPPRVTFEQPAEPEPPETTTAETVEDFE